MNQSADSSRQRTSEAGRQLWQRLLAATRTALASGAQQPIATEDEYLQDRGCQFLVRVVSQLARKPTGSASRAGAETRTANPFLPCDPALFVADLTATHVALLNKFNVVAHHLLIVTRRYESQDSLLTQDDFAALWLCLQQYEGLGFYNAGTTAGASQPHKHLQLVPLPLASRGLPVPLEPAIVEAQVAGVPRKSPRLAFPHGVIGLELDSSLPVAEAARQLSDRYLALRRFLHLAPTLSPSAGQSLNVAHPYNLLVTRQWMLLVPRRREKFLDVSLNALAFAGALLVRDREQLQALRQAGLFTALEQTAGYC